MRGNRSIAAGLLALVALAGPGCGGSTDTTTPVACLEGTGTYLAALRDAPGQVGLNGETPISECLTQNQPGGDLATVGGAMVEAATRLNAEGRAQPRGPAPLRLGYLVGAAERGAEDTAGIHAELVRRLDAAASYSPGQGPPPAAFSEGYADGFDAGKAEG
jgi:hypothetical protein